MVHENTCYYEMLRSCFFRNTPRSFFLIPILIWYIFPKGQPINKFIEKQFKGPVQQQIKQALSYIQGNIIYIYNLVGPDRSILQEDFKNGQVFPKRYRNRRLGDFLKELELTEGRATGIPVILESLRHNGSTEPIF